MFSTYSFCEHFQSNDMTSLNMHNNLWMAMYVFFFRNVPERIVYISNEKVIVQQSIFLDFFFTTRI